MFAVVKKLPILSVLLLSPWLTGIAQGANDETQPPTLAELTQATLELRHDLLSAEEAFFRLNQNTLTIYVNIDNLAAPLLGDITITLGGQNIVQHRFEPHEYEALNAGAMKKIYAAPLEPGRHELTTLINAQSSDGKNTTTLELEKGPGHDTLKITIANPLQKRRPELFFEQQRGSQP